MDKLLTVTALRRVVQAAFFMFFVYGGYVFSTYYTTDKLTRALPALSCAFDEKGGDYCALIALQHQTHHRLSSLVKDSENAMVKMIPTAVTIGTVVVLVALLGKAFCGWGCPLGFFQELTSLIAQKLKFRQIESLTPSVVSKLRPIKWVIFLLFVLIFPFLTGLGFLSEELGSPYCLICPSRIVTTLATGDASQAYISTATPLYFALSLIADLMFGLMVAFALFVRQPFCRICPILALQSSFKFLSLPRLVKNGSSSCDSCGQCAKACPMDIREISKPQEKQTNITHTDCTMCARCVEFCPHNNVLSFKYGPFYMFKSSKDYFKKRVKIDKWWKGS